MVFDHFEHVLMKKMDKGGFSSFYTNLAASVGELRQNTGLPSVRQQLKMLLFHH